MQTIAQAAIEEMRAILALTQQGAAQSSDPLASELAPACVVRLPRRALQLRVPQSDVDMLVFEDGSAWMLECRRISTDLDIGQTPFASDAVLADALAWCRAQKRHPMMTHALAAQGLGAEGMADRFALAIECVLDSLEDPIMRQTDKNSWTPEQAVEIEELLTLALLSDPRATPDNNFALVSAFNEVEAFITADQINTGDAAAIERMQNLLNALYPPGNLAGIAWLPNGGPECRESGYSPFASTICFFTAQDASNHQRLDAPRRLADHLHKAGLDAAQIATLVTPMEASQSC